MAITKASARSVIRALLRDPSSDVWNTSSLDVMIQMVLDELWGDVLDHASYLLSQLDTVTVTSPGYVDLRTVADGGKLTQRFNRLQKVTRDTLEYAPAAVSNVVLANGDVVTAPNRTYVLYGSQLYLFPLTTTTQVEIRYNYLPALFTTLPDTQNVAWPEGYEAAFIHEVVARATTDQIQQQIQAGIASSAQQKLKASIARPTVGPQIINAMDSAENWGGNA